MRKVPERFIWASTIVSVNPNDKVLEIGCGAGILAEQIIENLSQGTFTGIDKSAAMIEKAKQRNYKSIKTERVKFEVNDLLKSKFPRSHFDLVVAFNVNLFWKSTGKELEIIRNSLTPKGTLYIFYQAPFEIDMEASKPIKEKLTENSFIVIDTLLKKLAPTSAICVIAKP